jgi:exodeoxyribonuclease VII large subunit
VTAPFIFRGDPRARTEEPFVFSVSGILGRMRRQLEGEYGDTYVGGEISSFQIHPTSGHAYFALKDQRSKLTCVMWKDSLERLRFRPQRGHEVIVRGRITIFERGGQMQMNVIDVEPRGAGALSLEFQQRLDELRAEGLTDPRRKRRLPPFPRTVGIVTSPGGAALRDLLQTILRRDPTTHVILSPAQVQGRSSSRSIVDALERLDALALADVVIVARGGGSLEDLWAFNESNVARAIARVSVPVVTGIGHETDTTIADLVADLRAATPTAAAELAIPERRQVEGRLAELSRRLDRGLAARTDRLGRRLLALEGRLAERAPERTLLRASHRMKAGEARAEQALANRITRGRSRLAVLAGRLEAMSPLAVLARGYALVETDAGDIVRRAADVDVGTRLAIRLAEGKIGVRVEDKG